MDIIDVAAPAGSFRDQWTDDEDMDSYGLEDSDELPPLEPIRRVPASKSTPTPKASASAKSVASTSGTGTSKPPPKSRVPSKAKSPEG